MKRKKIIIGTSIVAAAVIGIGAFYAYDLYKESKKVLPKQAKELVIEEIKEEPPLIVEETLERTVTTMYASAINGLNIREYSDMESNIIDTVPLNTELEVYDDFELDGWYMIKYNDNDYYIWGEYVSIELTEIPESEPVYYETESYNYDYSYADSNSNGIYTASQFKSMGVLDWGGWHWTWYSQNVLPGGGLDIPGRYIDSSGFVCDGDGYICLAASSLSKGSIVSTPFGKDGKVYDSGCAVGTVDVYTNF